MCGCATFEAKPQSISRTETLADNFNYLIVILFKWIQQKISYVYLWLSTFPSHPGLHNILDMIIEKRKFSTSSSVHPCFQSVIVDHRLLLRMRCSNIYKIRQGKCYFFHDAGPSLGNLVAILLAYMGRCLVQNNTLPHSTHKFLRQKPPLSALFKAPYIDDFSEQGYVWLLMVTKKWFHFTKGARQMRPSSSMVLPQQRDGSVLRHSSLSMVLLSHTLTSIVTFNCVI